MTLPEVLTLLEMNRPSNHAGRLTNDIVDDLEDDMELSDDEWWAKNGAS